ncbi:MAG: hypothetical protein RSC88_09935, partial [Oscillospiraceae bacterium]
LSGCITYSDETTTYSDVFYIDFDTYATFFSVNSDKDDFLNQMKSQTKELKNIGKRLEQISIDSQERKAK